MRKHFRVLLLASIALLPTALAQDAMPEGVDVVVTLTNVESVAWVVTAVQVAEGVEAADVAELDVRNPTLTLTPGLRYRFDNNGGAAHPLDFRKKNARFLLAQGNVPGSLEDDEAVDFVDDAEGVTFTLTPELAEDLALYYCTVHPDMVGDIVTGAAE
ncbi:hypothetical protein BH24DEI2_BH24DEI2_24540 [soil metagenome]